MIHFNITYFNFRTHKEAMVKLSKLLSKSSKSRRHRRNILNIQITILAWLVEFIGFFLIVLGSLILRHQNSIVTLSLQTFTFTLYFIIVPSVFLINDSHFKGIIIESNWYISFLNIFSCGQLNEIEEECSEVNQNNHIFDDTYDEGCDDTLQDVNGGNIASARTEEEEAHTKTKAHTTDEKPNTYKPTEPDNKRVFQRTLNMSMMTHEILSFHNDCTVTDIELNE